jgi:hypothetical protein
VSLTAWIVMWTSLSFMTLVVSIGLFGGNDTGCDQILRFLASRQQARLNHELEMAKVNLKMLGQGSSNV